MQLSTLGYELLSPREVVYKFLLSGDRLFGTVKKKKNALTAASEIPTVFPAASHKTVHVSPQVGVSSSRPHARPQNLSSRKCRLSGETAGALGPLPGINAQVMTRQKTRFPLLGSHLCDRIACRLERGPFSMISALSR